MGEAIYWLCADIFSILLWLIVTLTTRLSDRTSIYSFKVNKMSNDFNLVTNEENIDEETNQRCYICRSMSDRTRSKA